MPEQADALSSASPVARALYEELLHALAPFGAFEVEVKKTSIHLVRSSAFAGVHPRKQHLLITIKAAAPIPSGSLHALMLSILANRPQLHYGGVEFCAVLLTVWSVVGRAADHFLVPQ
jgi:hypothetical protein